MHPATRLASHLAAFGSLLVLTAASPVAVRAQAAPKAGAAEARHADPASSGALYDELVRMDSLLFDAGFVTCDAEKVHAMLTEDAEFYHDKTGLESGSRLRESFERLTGSCPRERGIRRELIPGSARVYPMQGYGAIQMGDHRFVERGAPTMTVAKFVHLWRKTDDGWKLSRVLSFDHRPVPSAPAP